MQIFCPCGVATSKTETVRLRGSKSETKAKEDLDPNLINLPLLPVKYVELISQFSKKFNLGENPSVTEVNHFSHDHPLILSEVQSNKDVKNDEISCNGCVEPISAPFYSCAQCSFHLHKCCVQLPETVQHPFHQRHPLYLRGQGPDNFYYFKCNNCNKLCNGFSFNCAGCYFSLDVTCASLSDTIKHEAHEHQLIHIRSPNCLCNACGEYLSGLALACKICGFYISNHCAMLPHTARHRYDEHPLYLSYPPFDDHPNKFYCEICEKEIDPKLWLYRCRDCCLSFHTRCISPVEDYPNFKFGKTFKARHHPDLLMVVRETMEDSKCDGCSEYFDDKPAFECEACNTMVCRRCTLYADF
ncbi:hypothetical protein F0562_015712 [Nyssa sinensis]|uniref:Phorbol-ester/DAG-type domain-containing protein n=1 Tax=Nyssa sinensis TaxID=561372 RepID=A0A5J4ZKW6_9ASTE|nr:hypothetical protein F0562_015712 [Nyssa sinensis]